MVTNSIAFCLIRFGANGGTFDQYGFPIDDLDENDMPIRSTCYVAFDCGTCQFMKQWVSSLLAQGWSVSWECVDCIKNTKKVDEEQGLERALPGYYQAGNDPDLTLSHPDYDPDRPPLTGCIRCGRQTTFLQLILKRSRGAG